MAARFGKHCGAAQKVFVRRTPSCATRSKLGVRTPLAPAADACGQDQSSAIANKIFGRCPTCASGFPSADSARAPSSKLAPRAECLTNCLRLILDTTFPFLVRSGCPDYHSFDEAVVSSPIWAPQRLAHSTHALFNAAARSGCSLVDKNKISQGESQMQIRLRNKKLLRGDFRAVVN